MIARLIDATGAMVCDVTVSDRAPREVVLPVLADQTCRWYRDDEPIPRPSFNQRVFRYRGWTEATGFREVQNPYCDDDECCGPLLVTVPVRVGLYVEGRA